MVAELHYNHTERLRGEMNCNTEDENYKNELASLWRELAKEKLAGDYHLTQSFLQNEKCVVHYFPHLQSTMS